MSNKIYHGEELLDKFVKGVNTIVKAVKSTLGPKGRNYVFMKDGEVRTTKDGVTVAKDIDSLDPFESMAMSIVRNASEKTAEDAGDGTTTSTVLAGYIINEGVKYSNKGENVVQMNKDMQKACNEVVEGIEALAKDVKEDNLESIATISGNNDVEIGKYIKKAFDRVGRDGVISLEESRKSETFLEKVEGMQFNSGFTSPYFVNNNNTMSCTFENPYVLLVDGTVSNQDDIIPILQKVSEEDKPLLVIANDVTGNAASLMLENKRIGTIKICAVKAPNTGAIRKEVLEDIAVMTGATVFSQEKGMKWNKFSFDYLGKCRRSNVKKDTTAIIDGKGDADAINERLTNLQNQVDVSNSDYEVEQLQERIARFSGGVAIIHVGGNSSTEVNEKKDRMEDALHATRAAQEEGIVPGGGRALLEARKNITRDTVGAEIVYRACGHPFVQILENIGLDTMEANYKAIELSDLDAWTGYNFLTGDYDNLLELGVIDPAKVTRCALENAVSVGKLFLLTECAGITEGDDKKEPFNPLAGMMP